MKKHAILVISGLLLSICLLFTGCGEGQGAEDTGEDGKVANGDRTSHSTTKQSDMLEGDDTRSTMDDRIGDMIGDDSMIP